MSNYEPMSAPPPEGQGVQPKGEPPPSIKTAVTIVWVSLALSVLGTILTFVFIDDIVDTAMKGQPATVSEDTVRTGVIVGTIFALLVFGALYVLLALFLRKGAGWARIVLTIIAVIGVVFGIFGLFGEQTAVQTILGIIQIAVSAALLYFLWRPDSTEFLKPQPVG